jgi:hypothetical protein
MSILQSVFLLNVIQLSAFLLSVFLLSAFLLSVFLRSAFLLSVFLLSAFWLSVILCLGVILVSVVLESYFLLSFCLMSIWWVSFCPMLSWWVTFCWVLFCSFLSDKNCFTECHFGKCQFAQWHSAKCHFGKCHSAQYPCSECCRALLLYAECHSIQSHSKCCYAEYKSVELTVDRHSAECRHAACRGALSKALHWTWRWKRMTEGKYSAVNEKEKES